MDGAWERRAAEQAVSSAQDAIRQIRREDYDGAVTLLNEAIQRVGKAVKLKKEGR